MGDELVEAITAEVMDSVDHRIPFARFMERALYHPEQGYYQRDRQKIGREGDFYTSTQVGDLFGIAIGRGLNILAQNFPLDQPWSVIEVGGGDGRLMEGVVQVLARKEKVAQPRIWMIESSPYHRRLQRERLSEAPLSVKWVSKIEEIPQYPTIVLSNELIDALPFHRLRWRNGDWREIWVSVDQERSRFVEVEGPVSEEQIHHMAKEKERIRLPEEGDEIEISLSGRTWIQNVGSWLHQGFILTIDYGGIDEEIRELSRGTGTTRGFQKHRIVEDILASPGEIDLTANVSFTSLQTWGEEVGLRSYWYGSQSHYLLETGILDEVSFGQDTDPFSNEAKRRRAFRQLALPGGMGDSYRVLIQAKGIQSKDVSVRR
ncbi:class I SAM-dependent methyltransferase [Marininema halotolerans]|uniref:SAM-dependent methyltransferase, MidA family n=1 Tax=Marininema halotolerans TaxID=1155944 RepID=A0A1I6QB07_9BACL|nr:SAM-dependent methyltransferase [Marininema halotolerans]SFS49693.1 SAM-dependent methyltransferase, MidA family [Marininema halotolerans]